MSKKILTMFLMFGSIFLAGCGNKEVSNANSSGSISNTEEAGEIDRSEEKKNYDDKIFISFKKGDKWGCMTLDGKVVIEPQYEISLDFFEGLALIRENGKFGYVNKNNEIVVEPQYDDAREFHEGCAGVCIKKKTANREFEKWGFINKNGELIFETECDEIGEYFSEGFANVCIGGKWGYIDTEGKFAVEPTYDKADKFQDGVALVEIKGYYQDFISREGFGPLMTNYNPYIDLKSYYEGLAYVEFCSERDENGMASVSYGYINEDGESVVDCDAAGCFSEGLAAVKMNGLWGYMNTDGEIVIEPQYEQAGDFSEGLAIVSFQEEDYLIDVYGNIVFQTDQYDLVLYDPEYSTIFNRVKSGMIVAEDENEDGRYFVLNINGDVLLDISHEYGNNIWISDQPLEEEVSFIYHSAYDEDAKYGWAEVLACIDRKGNVVWDRRDYNE